MAGSAGKVWSVELAGGQWLRCRYWWFNKYDNKVQVYVGRKWRDL